MALDDTVVRAELVRPLQLCRTRAVSPAALLGPLERVGQIAESGSVASSQARRASAMASCTSQRAGSDDVPRQQVQPVDVVVWLLCEHVAEIDDRRFDVPALAEVARACEQCVGASVTGCVAPRFGGLLVVAERRGRDAADRCDPFEPLGDRLVAQ